MADFQDLLNIAHDKLQEKQKLPEKFCKLNILLQTLPPTIPEEVQGLTDRLTQQIQAYNEQFLLLKQELGVLCSQEPGQQDKVTTFFSSFLDLFKMAYTVYQEDPKNREPFQKLLEKFLQFLETNTMTLETPLEKGLLLQLTNFAWTYTKSQESMSSMAKQVGGKLKRHTRKQKRKA